jgi:hypothetical protein
MTGSWRIPTARKSTISLRSSDFAARMGRGALSGCSAARFKLIEYTSSVFLLLIQVANCFGFSKMV